MISTFFIKQNMKGNKEFKLIDSNLDLTYIRNNLYYKERKKENNKLVYKYFDVKSTFRCRQFKNYCDTGAKKFLIYLNTGANYIIMMYIA